MKSLTCTIVFILFTTLVLCESFKIKRDLTLNNKENAINSPIIMNDEDFNAIEKRKAKTKKKQKKPRRSVSQRLASLEKQLKEIKELISKEFLGVQSRLNSVPTVVPHHFYDNNEIAG
uniref:Plasmodium yoelii subtelomeric region (PYST-C1) n=1 Tax=Strongyloides venezuelensis TaxID=75913 RepID=A0A0K0FD49_STRVS